VTSRRRHWSTWALAETSDSIEGSTGMRGVNEGTSSIRVVVVGTAMAHALSLDENSPADSEYSVHVVLQHEERQGRKRTLTRIRKVEDHISTSSTTCCLHPRHHTIVHGRIRDRRESQRSSEEETESQQAILPPPHPLLLPRPPPTSCILRIGSLSKIGSPHRSMNVSENM
jgi:hypothetical protein